jgi:hypothetical protein
MKDHPSLIADNRQPVRFDAARIKRDNPTVDAQQGDTPILEVRMAKKRSRKSTDVVKKKAARKRVKAEKGAKSRKAKKRPAKKATKRGKKTKTKRSTVKNKPRLGRPKVSGDEKLYLLFKEDYHARQIFAFLGVETVRDLEQYSPRQIVQLLSRPIKTTVERIRHKLAEKNRYLLDDDKFARSHQRD